MHPSRTGLRAGRSLLRLGALLLLLGSAVVSARADSLQTYSAPFVPAWHGISQVAVDGQGGVWAGSTAVDALRRMSGGTTSRFDLPLGSAPSRMISAGGGIDIARPGLGGAAAVSATGDVQALGNSPEQAYGIARASDGTVWVGGEGKLTKYPPTGSPQDYPLPTAIGSDQTVLEVAIGGDGAVWFTTGYDVQMNKLGRVAPDGSVDLVLSSASGEGWPDFRAQALAATSDGHAWLALNNGSADVVRRVAPDGSFLDVSVTGTLATSADDQVYALNYATLSKIDHTGSVTTSSIPMADAADSTGTLAVEPSGGLAWVSALSDNTIVRRNSGGTFSTVTPDTGTADLPTGVAVAPDGAAWIAERGSGRVARLAKDGTVQQYAAGFSGAPSLIRADPTGGMWAIESSGAVAHISSSGAVAETPLPNAGTANPVDLAVDSSGTLWVVDAGNKTIDRRPAGGSFTALPTGSGSAPLGIALDGSGGWFTEPDGDSVAHITPTGTVTRHDFTGSGDRPGWIAVASDGTLWIDDTTNHKVAVLSSAGTVLRQLGTAGSVGRLDAAGDGRVWTNDSCGRIGYATSASKSFYYVQSPVASSNCDSRADITIAADGDIWATAPDAGRVIRYTPTRVAVPDTTPPTITISTPVEGQHFAQGAIVVPIFHCTDDVGIASCDGARGTVFTNDPGDYTYFVTATDTSGNEATAVVPYVVDPAPTNAGGSTNPPDLTAPTPVVTPSNAPPALAPAPTLPRPFPPVAPPTSTVARKTLATAVAHISSRQIAAVLSRGTTTVRLSLGTRGTVVILIDATIHGKKTTLARGQATSAITPARVVLRRNRSATKALKGKHSVRATIRASWRPKAGASITVTRRVTLRFAGR